MGENTTTGEKPKLKHDYGKIDFDYAIHLATRPPEEDGPIYMVNLMKYHEVAQYDTENAPKISGREADDRYNPASILNKIGATIVFVADFGDGGTMAHWTNAPGDWPSAMLTWATGVLGLS